MKTKQSILAAFLLNLGFAVFEFIGGVLTGSIAVASDALHDLGDAISIGTSYLLERKSQRPPDGRYTYGYGRYSVLGAAITTVILLLGSLTIIYQSILRLQNPAPVHHDGMLIMALVGIAVNTCAAWFTRSGESVNQKAVNLHMLEDILGWIAVLIGAVVIRFTGWFFLDPILSLCVAIFILYHAFAHLREVIDIILQKVPKNIDPQEVMAAISQIDGVLEVHHLHVWSLDGHRSIASMHIVTDDTPLEIKSAVRKALEPFHIHHITMELECSSEECKHPGYYSYTPIHHHGHHH